MQSQQDAKRSHGQQNAPGTGISNRNQESPSTRDNGAPSSAWASAPTLSLPKAGGALRGLGESYAVNAPTGTVTYTVPLPITSSRFAPSLSLTYNSGNGNGVFGQGWDLAVPAVSRKTDRGIPRYHDDTDIFELTGAEELVPELARSPQGDWSPRPPSSHTWGAANYQVHRFRPRAEAAFARIERWTDVSTGVVHWRSISRDNITTLYGTSEDARIADPEDSRRIFRWMLTATYDARGNAQIYEYRREDSAAILSAPHETNRTQASRRSMTYLKSIRYGNAISRLLDADIFNPARSWHFEIVFDYGDHRLVSPGTQPDRSWPARPDPFSSYRAGFELRTYRLCQRILMFHHFPEESLVGPNCLVGALKLTYRQPPLPDSSSRPASSPISACSSFLSRLQYIGYRRNEPPSTNYQPAFMPPLDFTYSEPRIVHELEEVSEESLENLPTGLAGAYRWLDLEGEGVPGILSEQGTAWYYKRNAGDAMFDSTLVVAEKPAGANLEGSGQMFLDVDSDGKLELVDLQGVAQGFFSFNTDSNRFDTFRPFESRPNIDTSDRNTQFVDLTGDGNADIIITEQEVFTFYQSRGQNGFHESHHWRKPLVDDESGPTLVLADHLQSVFFSDMSGDGLADLVRVRSADICYWPNLGYGRFGPKVTMDNAPWLDGSEMFHGQRIRMADIDGSGTTDIIYLGCDGKVRLYFNMCGNGWSAPVELRHFPLADELTNIHAIDLLGNGTTCLVWSSLMPGTSKSMKYVNLVGTQKPHLLLAVADNRGSETHLQYGSSTRHYLLDKRQGKPWVTRLPFPVQVVEKVKVLDRISGNEAVSTYRYHHGFYDGIEREFRGFGMVEQWDAEQIDVGAGPPDEDEPVSAQKPLYVPPIHTKTWYHTGALIEGRKISSQFTHEYFGHDLPGFDQTLLQDTVLPASLAPAELLEAARALKGSVLRKEVYADDFSDLTGRPYSISERNMKVELLQPLFAGNRHASVHVHPLETIDYHYERDLNDPRVNHQIILEVNEFGDTRKSIGIAYGRLPGKSPLTHLDDVSRQEGTVATYTESEFTGAILNSEDDYMGPLPAESRTFELTGLSGSQDHKRFSYGDFAKDNFKLINDLEEVPFETDEIDFSRKCKRLVEHVRTRYRSDDLTALLPLRTAGPRALPGEDYRLAFTAGLIQTNYLRQLRNQTALVGLIPDPASLLEGKTDGRGGYRDLDGDGNWWVPSPRIYYSTEDVTAEEELRAAQEGSFVVKRIVNQFDHALVISYDDYNLLPIAVADPLNNIIRSENDYRLYRPSTIVDSNGNRSSVTCDALGVVVGTAVAGKPGEGGDNFDDFEPELSASSLAAFLDDPKSSNTADLLQNATTRVIYDMGRFADTAGESPVYSALVEREEHYSDVAGTPTFRVKITYFDGHRNEVQIKSETTPGPVAVGGPEINPRWIGSGWTVFSNKGKPVRKYEPFFDEDHHFQSNHARGVGPISFYDPPGRVVAIIHPNHTYEKMVFSPWQQADYDSNDTVSPTSDASTDLDVAHLFARVRDSEYKPSWFENSKGTPEEDAATKTVAHRNTPTVKHYDSLGRPFVTVQDNGSEGRYTTRTVLDVEGNLRQMHDARDRLIVKYRYDLQGRPISKMSFEAGATWTLHDVLGRTLYEWDSKGRRHRCGYDELRRPSHFYVQQTPNGTEFLVNRLIYGETPLDSVVPPPASPPRPPDPSMANLRGRTWRIMDQAGQLTTESYDLQGNISQETRQFATEYKDTLDWRANVALDIHASFTTATQFDALSRVVRRTTSDNSTTRYFYNETKLLNKIEASILGDTQNGAEVWTGFLNKAEYDEKLRPSTLTYANSTVQKFAYDRLHFRLSRIQTVKGSSVLQDLNYVYDPVGNIVSTTDKAQQTIFFRGQIVEPTRQYTYDALYRLTESTGREHLATSSMDPYDNYHSRLPHPGDANAIGNFTESYAYDSVGNLQRMRHDNHDSQTHSWTRTYLYGEESLLEPGIPTIRSNRLSSTIIATVEEKNTYDEHGNIIKMHHLEEMRWNHRDQLSATTKQRVSPGSTPETTYYVYDANGKRIRKITETFAPAGGTPSRSKERFYLEGLDVHREFNVNHDIVLERQTLLVNADKSSVARVENRTIGSEGTLPRRLIRYQLSDLLSSCSLEIDPHGDLISYEEYTAFGSTAYQAVRNTSKAVKYIRFMGKERDEESGFYYCNDRYFAPWLGRWTACDPSGLVDGPNLYVYAQNRPTTLIDPTGRKANEPAETATSEASKGRRSSKPAKPPTPEYIEFEKRVGTPEDPGGTKILTAEEKGSHLADVRTTEHFEAVKKVVNEAIIIATEHFRDKTTGELTAVHDEILAYALMELIKPMREKDLKNSQNLILRDADHYFAGRIQEWQILFPNSFVALTLQSSATVTYDMGKMISWKVSSWFEDDDDAAAKKSSGQTPSIIDTSEQPASPGGGWEFADLGMRHFVRDSAKSDEKVAPALLTETFEGEQKHFERELQRQIDAARFRGMMGYP